jgi:hypothetical protein
MAQVTQAYLEELNSLMEDAETTAELDLEMEAEKEAERELEREGIAYETT